MADNLHVHSADEGKSRFDYAYEQTQAPEADSSLVDELPPDATFDVMAFGGQSTVAAAQPFEGKRSTNYQSEAELETGFIRQLQRQAYEYVHIRSEAELIANLRRQLEALNSMSFTDKE